MKDYKLTIRNATSDSVSPKSGDAKGCDSKETGYLPKNVMDQDTSSCFSTSESGNFHWLQLELKEETAIWKVQIFARTDCCEDRLLDVEIRIGNYKMPEQVDGIQTTTISNSDDEANRRAVTNVLESSELCGKIPGKDEVNEELMKGSVFLIDCLTKDGQDLSGKYITVLSLNATLALTFNEIEAYGAGNILLTQLNKRSLVYSNGLTNELRIIL